MPTGVTLAFSSLPDPRLPRLSSHGNLPWLPEQPDASASVQSTRSDQALRKRRQVHGRQPAPNLGGRPGGLGKPLPETGYALACAERFGFALEMILDGFKRVAALESLLSEA